MLSEDDTERLRRGPHMPDVVDIMRVKHIESATNMPLVIKARLITDVGLTVNWGDRDYEEHIRVFGQQLTAFENHFRYNSVDRDVYAVRWHPSIIDTDLKYEKYFKQFDMDGVQAYTDLIDKEYVARNIDASRVPTRVKFIVKTHCLTEVGYYTLHSYFLQSNYAFIMDLMYRIAKLIKPEAWGTSTSVIQ